MLIFWKSRIWIHWWFKSAEKSRTDRLLRRRNIRLWQASKSTIPLFQMKIWLLSLPISRMKLKVWLVLWIECLFLVELYCVVIHTPKLFAGKGKVFKLNPNAECPEFDSVERITIGKAGFTLKEEGRHAPPAATSHTNPHRTFQDAYLHIYGNRIENCGNQFHLMVPRRFLSNLIIQITQFCVISMINCSTPLVNIGKPCIDFGAALPENRQSLLDF